MSGAERSAQSRWGLTLLRMVIGWHLLYEGVSKLLAKHWTSAEYLSDSTWLLAGVFRSLAGSPGLLRVVDFLNMWGLTLIGLALLLGLRTRLFAALGALLVALYYVSNPPFVGLRGVTAEGDSLIINKNLIEIVGLLVILMGGRGATYGLDNLIAILRDRRRPAPPVIPVAVAAAAPVQEGPPAAGRRELLKNLVGAPAVGAFCYAVDRQRRWVSLEEKHLLESGADVATSATLKKFTFSRLQDLKGTMTYGKLGNLKVSRLIMGGNLVGGWAHARDLIYVSELIKAYHSDQRVINTFRLAEKCGVNTFMTHPKLLRIIRKYWDEYGGTIQFISDCGGEELAAGVKQSIEGGAHACYVQGAWADRLVKENKTDEIRRALDTIRSHGLAAGIGGHPISTIRACVDQGIKPDFWMKTLHHHKYWTSRTSEGDQDNNWCLEPEETIEFMKSLPEPWVAFKVLAAGAIPPKDGFAYAFNNGADFICVGMYDFQMVDDVNIAMEILGNVTERSRPWRA